MDFFTYFKYFESYANIRGIETFKKLSNTEIENYISFLRTFVTTKNVPLKYNCQKQALTCLKAIIHWCQIHRPNDVPITEIFTGNEYTGTNRKLKIDFIPDDVVAQINEALKAEKNPYLKYGIIILQATGMRIGDLLKLRVDCIKPHLINGYTIKWTQHKVRRDTTSLPVRNECLFAIEKLIEITAGLRDETDDKDKDILMIHRINSGRDFGKIRVISQLSFGKWLRNFVIEHNIKDANEDYFHLTSSHFRRTLGTDMLSKGTNINVIQQVLGHSTPVITRRFYADVKDKERGKVFSGIGIIGNINQIQPSAFDSVSEFEQFNANKDKYVAGLCDGYCTKPVTDGNICPRLLKRQKCYTCSRYITTPEYLEVHKLHLENLERQMEEGAIYGEHYAEHFIPTIQVLKVIIERLEGLQDEN